MKELDNEQLIKLFDLDEEVIGIENIDNTVYPVLKAYDDEEIHFHFWCIHCRVWHVHGRGGPEAVYKEDDIEHRTARCVATNSPFKQNGVILKVVGKLTKEVKKKHRKGKDLYCPKCKRLYSAAFNACSCSFINKNRRLDTDTNMIAETYQSFLLA